VQVYESHTIFVRTSLLCKFNTAVVFLYKRKRSVCLCVSRQVEMAEGEDL
jgi:hypothetical protein